MKQSVLAMAVLAGAVNGCGGSVPNLVSVCGTVKLDGTPLEGAVVSFLPDFSINEAGQPGEAITSKDGSYQAGTRGRSGLVPGRYLVVVRKTSPAFKDDPDQARLAMKRLRLKKGRKVESSADNIEEHFDKNVPPDGGTIDLDVKSKAPQAAAEGPKKAGR